jgi:hypothetical protein
MPTQGLKFTGSKKGFQKNLSSMDNLNDIQKIWFTANVNGLPESGEVIKTIKNYHTRQFMKTLFLILMSLVLGSTMVYVVFFYQSTLLTTRIGEACILIAIFILLVTNIILLKKIPGRKDFSNNEFVNYLKHEQQRQIQFHKKTQAIGFALSSAGLLLYFFEMVYRQWVLMIIAYLLLILFILICWFIIRPASLRKKTKKLQGTIEKLEIISNQFSND